MTAIGLGAQAAGSGQTMAAAQPHEPPTTLEQRVTILEQRMEVVEGRVAVSETICSRMINELNTVRIQLGLNELDQNYYQS